MRIIHIKKIDKLMTLTEKLRIITYLMLLIDEEENFCRITGYEDILKTARSNLIEQNSYVLNELNNLIDDKTFTKASK